MSTHSHGRRILLLTAALMILTASIANCIWLGPQVLLRVGNLLFVRMVFEEASPDGAYVAMALKVNVHATTPLAVEASLRQGWGWLRIGPDRYGIGENKTVFGAEHAVVTGLRWLDERTLLIEYSGSKYLEIWRQEDSWRDVRIIYRQVE